MNPNISITLNTPHVTIERYSELTGLPVDTINGMLADGRLSGSRWLRQSQNLTSLRKCGR